MIINAAYVMKFQKIIKEVPIVVIRHVLNVGKIG
jgi:hypothetical protein